MRVFCKQVWMSGSLGSCNGSGSHPVWKAADTKGTNENANRLGGGFGDRGITVQERDSWFGKTGWVSLMSSGASLPSLITASLENKRITLL